MQTNNLSKKYTLIIFSQKLTSWVFHDQPCECADMGHSGTIGRAAKMGWKKKSPDPAHAILHMRSCVTDPILSTQRISRSGDPIVSTQRIPRCRAGGRCVRKWRFSKEETAFGGYKHFSGALVLYF